MDVATGSWFLLNTHMSDIPTSHTSHGQHPSRLRVWIEAMRLRTLPVSVAGVLAGTGVAAAYGGFHWPSALVCLLFAVMAQIASNFANEYYDFRNGLDRKGREGFRRGVTEGDISPRAMRNATYALLVIDALLGCSLLLRGGWWLIPVGVAVALFAVAYSTGPYPLSHHGLGDIAVIVFFGFVPVIFTAYVQTRSWEMLGTAWPVAGAVGLMAANVLVVNNYRDMEDDRAAGKRTTVVIFGRRAMSTAYLASGILAAALLTYACAARGVAVWWMGSIAGYLTAHTALYLQLRKRRGAALNPLLGMTAMLLLAVSCILLTALATV